MKRDCETCEFKDDDFCQVADCKKGLAEHDEKLANEYFSKGYKAGFKDAMELKNKN